MYRYKFVILILVIAPIVGLTLLSWSDKGSKSEFIVEQDQNLIALEKSIVTDSLVFIYGDNTIMKPFLTTDRDIHVYVPDSVGLDSIKIRLLSSDGNVYVDGQLVDKLYNTLFDFSDFRNPHIIRISTSSGVDNNWHLLLYDIPVVVINTPDKKAIISKTERDEGCEVLLINENGAKEILGTAGIRGRGNLSWGIEKKPYNIELDKNHEFLGMKSSKHWLLLANCYLDRTQLRNDVAFEMARQTDFPWVQSGDF